MSPQSQFDASVLNFKQNLARKLLFGLLILCTVALPISLARWPVIGFQFIFIHHIAITVIVYVAFFWPYKKSYLIDYWVIILSFASMFVSGVLSFGLQSGALSFVILCSFLLVIAHGIKVALLFALLVCTFIVSIGIATHHAWFTININPDLYGKAWSSWAVLTAGLAMTIVLILIISYYAYSLVNSLIKEINEQNNKIKYLADHDELTGFLNRRLAKPFLDEAILLAKRENHQLALLFVDLDEFKQINDIFGHETGDMIISTCAKRLNEALREADLSFRVGGDEFMFILQHINDKANVDLVLNRIEASLSQPIQVEGHPHIISASIGVAMFPQDALDGKSLRIKADKSMYEAKQKNLSFVYYHNRTQ